MSTADPSRRGRLEFLDLEIDGVVEQIAKHERQITKGSDAPPPLVAATPRSRRLIVLLRLLQIIRQALEEGVVLTKRDIFYRDPELFGSQGVVDRAVDSLSRRLGVSRASLNVTASAKGLTIGDFKWLRRSGETSHGLSDPSGMLIKMISEHDILDVSKIAWVLVVEKDATFQALAGAQLHSSPLLLPGMIVTGKGYPDLATRAFTNDVSSAHGHRSRPPVIYGLVDGDPDGLSILSTYKHGSAALENEKQSLQVPSMLWMGVKISDSIEQNMHRPRKSHMSDARHDVLLRLTARDRRKACSMLNSSVCDEDGSEREWRRELQVMLRMNFKVEIQHLEAQRGGVVSWLEARLPKRCEES